MRKSFCKETSQLNIISVQILNIEADAELQPSSVWGGEDFTAALN